MDREEQFKGGRGDLNVPCTQTAADLVAEVGATQNPNKLGRKAKDTVWGSLPESNKSGENINYR